MIDHKAALRALAAEDGCKASLLAAAHIEYIERQLASSRDYSENLRRKLERVRHQRNELRRQLMEREHGGISCGDSFASNRRVNLGDGAVSGVCDV
jgi:hypothetical protein